MWKNSWRYVVAYKHLPNSCFWILWGTHKFFFYYGSLFSFPCISTATPNKNCKFVYDEIYTRKVNEKDALAISQAAQKRVLLFKMDRQTHWQQAQEIWIKDFVKIVNMRTLVPIYVRAREKCKLIDFILQDVGRWRHNNDPLSHRGWWGKSRWNCFHHSY